MISLLPLRLVIAWLAVIYGVIVVGLLYGLQEWRGPIGLPAALKLALGGAAPIQLLLLGLLTFGWRKIWRWVPPLSDALFPDLNGSWAMSIEWTRDGASGRLEAKALIRQDFFRMSMEVDAPHSDSQTLSVHPKRDPESGRPILHYLYRVTPRASGGAPVPYDGAAILRFYRTPKDELRGNYWTTTPSVGHFVLTRPSG